MTDAEVHLLHLERLSLVKHLYDIGVEQAREPEPLSFKAALTFHDAVELFLVLALESLEADYKAAKTEFMSYFGLINERLEGSKLSQRTAMKKLNQIRVSLKHHGVRPSQFEIDACLHSARLFFHENTPLVFQVDFDEISLVDLVPFTSVREQLKLAEKTMAAGDFAKAMSLLAVGFEELLHSVQTGYFERFYRSPFPPVYDFSFDKAFFRRNGIGITDSKQEEFEDKLIKSIEGIAPVALMLSLGIDYQKYARFRLLTPVVHRTLAGTYNVQVVQGLAGSIDWPPSKSACEFCMRFVIEASIRVADKKVDQILDLSSQDR